MRALASIDTQPPGEMLWRRSAGLVPYEAAIARMQQDVAEIAAGGPERIWFLEHPPLYSAGSSARDADLVAPTRFPIHRSFRGGQWTYHGPGQRIAYVMLNLTRPHGTLPARDVHRYVEALQTWIIAALARFGVRGEVRPGRVGIWVAGPQGDEKIAAIGVRITRWIAWHGIAVNVSPDLGHYSGIVPCGIREHGVTSLAALGIAADMAQIDDALMAEWEPVFGRE